MCGITGWFSPTAICDDGKTRLQRMIRTIRHRGPDGEGAYFANHVAMGHARLAIIDLESGRQPMHSHDGRLVISYNGEIYNYKEIRKDLEKIGHQFVTNSDTEVIMELYRAEGWRGFSRLRGMYAFSLWDSKDRSALLVRDPVGIKPLFVSIDSDGTLVYGSEAKSILAYNKVQSVETNLNSLHFVMNFRYLPGSMTMFRGIDQLNPGEVLSWAPGKPFIKHDQLPLRPYPDKNVLESFKESVDLHLTSDVEVGAFLSGGIDSASICAVASGKTSKTLRSFTIKLGDNPDEATNAARSAEILGIENIQEDLAPVTSTWLRDLIWHLEVPKINALQSSAIARLASRHVKVALSGLGADEYFYGYNAHRYMHLMSLADKFIPKYAGEAVGKFGAYAISALNTMPWTEGERGFRILANQGNWSRCYGLLRNVWDCGKMRKMIYGPRLNDIDLPNVFEYLEENMPAGNDPVVAMAIFESKNKMVNDLLWQEDRLGMAEGMEIRVPFVDGGLIYSLRNIPRIDFMKGHKTKHYMRSMLEQVLVPEILNRPKSGFQIQSHDFFHKQLRALAYEILSEERVKTEGLFNPVFVNQLLHLPPKKMYRWHFFMLFLMLLSHLWIDIYEKGEWPTKIEKT